MAVYDTEENKDTQTLPSEDDLRSVTDISKSDEAGMESNAEAGSKQDLADKENDASSGKTATPESKEESKLNSLYNPASTIGKKRNFKLNKKQGGGLAGAIMGLALLWVGMTTSGPLQFIHLSQLMQTFHFSDQENASSNRASKLIKWMYYKDASRARLGILAGTYSERIEKNLNKNGFSTKYNKTTGTFLGYEFEPKKAKEGAFTDLSNRDDTKVQGALKEGLAAKKVVTVGPGKYFIPSEGLSNRENRRLLKYTYDVSNTKGKVISAYEKRLLIKRANLSFNPLTRLDSKINQALADKLKKVNADRKAKLAGKVTAPPINVSPKEGTANNPDTARATKEGTQLAEDAKTSGKLSTSAKAVGGGAVGSVAIVGLLCIVRSVAANVDESQKINAAVPIRQVGSEALSLGAKAQAGDDIDMSIIDGVYSKSLYSKENGSWSGANSIMYEQGKTESGKTLPSELNPNPENNAASEFLNEPVIASILNGACPIIESPLVAVIGLIAAPVSGAATFFAMQAFIPWIESLFTNEPVDVTQPQYAGGVYGELANVGGRLIANETASAKGGRPLSNNEELALKAEVKNGEQSLPDTTRSIADRMLNPYKYDTPVAKAIDTINPNSVTATVAQLPRKLISMGVLPLKQLSTKVGAADVAANPSDVYYGIPKVGYAPGVLDSVENPYENATKAADILMGPQAGTYIDLLDKCNNITVDTTGGVLDFGTKAEPITDFNELAKKDARCANDSDPKMTIVRVAAFDTITMKSMVCLDFDDEKSCADISQSSEPVNDTTTSLPGAAGWTWPVKKETLDNPSGAGLNQCWLHYREASDGYHAAIDIDVSYKPVYAANSGKVVRKASDSVSTLVIQHDGGLASVYMHMSSITVKEGDTVTAGQQIGTSGEVGSINAPHLHFGITTDPARFGLYADPWATVNPLDFLPNDYSAALLKNANGGSCVTSEIKGQKGYGFDIYKVKGTYALYK